MDTTQYQVEFAHIMSMVRDMDTQAKDILIAYLIGYGDISTIEQLKRVKEEVKWCNDFIAACKI